MTNDKFKPINKQFNEPNLPKTYEQFILEEKDLSQQDLYPDLDYEDIGEQRGYGPMTRGMIRVSVNKEFNKLEQEIKRKREQGICTGIGCQSLAEIGEYCALHKREQSQTTWVLKTAADTAASVFIPGYAVVKAVWRGIDGIKDEAKSEAWDAATTVASGSSSFGGYFSTGMGILSSGLDWKTHQDHVDRGENYRSGCPVCRS